MAGLVDTPGSALELRQAILDRYESLSGRLQQIARHVLDYPHEFALETLGLVNGALRF